MIHPQVNLNGTSRSELFAQYHACGIALCDAIGKLKDAMPHPRDYPNFPTAYSQAREEHLARIRVLFDMSENMREIVEALT